MERAWLCGFCVEAYQQWRIFSEFDGAQGRHSGSKALVRAHLPSQAKDDVRTVVRNCSHVTHLGTSGTTSTCDIKGTKDANNDVGEFGSELEREGEDEGVGEGERASERGRVRGKRREKETVGERWERGERVRKKKWKGKERTGEPEE
jgi:hypothetical protein